MAEPIRASRLAEIRTLLAEPVPCARGCSAPARYEVDHDDMVWLLCDSCADMYDCADDDHRLSEHQTPERHALADLLAEVERLTFAQIDRDGEANRVALATVVRRMRL